MDKILKSDSVKNTLLGSVLNFSRQNILVQDKIGLSRIDTDVYNFIKLYLLIIVDDVQLADTPEILVKELHIIVDYLQS